MTSIVFSLVSAFVVVRRGPHDHADLRSKDIIRDMIMDMIKYRIK